MGYVSHVEVEKIIACVFFNKYMVFFLVTYNFTQVKTMILHNLNCNICSILMLFQWQQDKNGTESREESEGKSSRVSDLLTSWLWKKGQEEVRWELSWSWVLRWGDPCKVFLNYICNFFLCFLQLHRKFRVND